MKRFAAFDIGGTYIKHGIVDENGGVLFAAQIPTHAQEGTEAIIAKIDSILQSLLTRDPALAGVGISTGGIVDTNKGEIIYANDNIPGYTGTAWKKIIMERFSLTAAVNNDVNATALAEAWVGAAKGYDNFFCVAIGTGIGGAAFVNGELYTGSHFRGAEIGYMSTRGANYEWYEKNASTSALIQAIHERTGEDGLNGKIIFQRAQYEHNAIYQDTLEQWADNLAKGIINVVCLFDPSLIIIGGGVSGAGDYLLSKIKKKLYAYLPGNLFESLELKTAQCGNRAGMIGSIYDLVF